MLLRAGVAEAVCSLGLQLKFPFNPWTGKFHMPQVWLQKGKKKNLVLTCFLIIKVICQLKKNGRILKEENLLSSHHPKIATAKILAIVFMYAD